MKRIMYIERKDRSLAGPNGIDQARATEDERQRSLDQDRGSKNQSCHSPRMCRPPREEFAIPSTCAA
jgi:hypothetical protein